MAKNDTKKDEGAPEADAPSTPPAENAPNPDPAPNPAPEADAPKAIVPVVAKTLREMLVANSWPTRDRIIDVFRNPVGIDGNLDPWWESNFIKYVEPPFRMVTSWQEINPNTGKLENKLLRRFRVHERVKPSIDRILAALWQEYGRDQEKIEADDLHLFGGGFEFRKMKNSNRLSLHAYGAAIDWDPDNNPQGTKWNADKGVPQLLIDLFEAEGWEWGGNFKGNSVDPMHFQACIE